MNCFVYRIPLFVTVFALVMVFSPANSESIFAPYGGKTTTVVPCINGFLISHSGSGPPLLMDTPATKRYAHFVPALQPGQAQLGRAGISTPCLQVVGYTFFGSPIIAPVGFGLVKVYEGTTRFPVASI